MPLTHRFLVAWIILFTGLTAFTIGQNRNAINQNRQLAKQGRDAHDALCVFKRDLELRVASTEALLEEHKGEATIFAIPRSVIRSSLANQQRAVDSLRTLDCQKEEP